MTNSPKHILIVGASGGIGFALCRALSGVSGVRITATFRSQMPSNLLRNVYWNQLDVASEAQICDLAATLREQGELDWIINCVGKLSIAGRGPEKNLQSIDPDFFMQAVRANTLPTLLLAKHFQPVLRRSKAPIFATISARVGSISDNRLGGWYSYRCAKSALNMALKNISIEWGRLMPNSCTVALHPGTTDTELSKPFQTNVPEGKLFSAQKTAELLKCLLLSLSRENNGQFLAYDGSLIEW